MQQIGITYSDCKEEIEVVRIQKFMLTAAIIVLAACGDGERRGAEVVLASQFSEFTRETNILIVSFDALRADALGIYGNDRPLTPEIDRWADDGVVFENFYVAAQATPTSFASSFTGQYPFRVFRGWKLGDHPRLAEIMQAAGYRTFGIFNNVQLVEERFFDQGYETYEVLTDPEDGKVLERADDALGKIGDEPFFGWVHFISPHAPYVARDFASHLYSNEYEGEFQTDSGPRPEPDNPRDQARVRELYDGEVLLSDMLFAAVIGLLEKHGLSDRTLVILTSDHGEYFGEHGRFRHETVHEKVIHVPFLMRMPGGHGEQVKVSGLHMNTDILPTLADLANAEGVSSYDGYSMLAAQPSDRLLIFTAMTERERLMMGARKGDHKLMVECPPPGFSESLFNLAEDPGETSDRILDDPALAGELFDAMSTLAGGDPCDVLEGAVRGAEMTQDLDDETIEKLRSLGYIQ